MINLEAINQQIEWTGLTIAAEEQPDEQPFPVQVRLLDFKEEDPSFWSRVQTACENAELNRTFLLAPIHQQEGVNAILFPINWVEELFHQWYLFRRYVEFLVFPQEEETRPIDDPLARSYAVVQQSNPLGEGVKAVHTIYENLRELEKHLHDELFVLEQEEYLPVLRAIIEEEEFDEMMVYIIKHLPEYTGSQMEAIGEDLWIGWKFIQNAYQASII